MVGEDTNHGQKNGTQIFMIVMIGTDFFGIGFYSPNL